MPAKKTTCKCCKKTIDPMTQPLPEMVVYKDDIGALHPVYAFRNLMAALFGKDYDVTVTLDFDEDKDETAIFNIVVGGCEHKAEAYRQVFNGSFMLGNTKCTLLVNGKKKSHKNFVTLAMLQAMLAGNPNFSRIYVKRFEDGSIDKWCILWANKTVTIANDQFNSYNGCETHSVEDLAHAVFHGKVESVLMHATDVGEYNGYWDNTHLG